MLGHMAWFCPSRTQGRTAQNPSGTTIQFPVDGGTQTMIWVDSPLHGLPAGYYPVGPANDAGTRRHCQATGVQATMDNSSGRITEVNDVASIDIVSSAAGKMAIGKDVVRYVNAIEDAYMAGRRRRNDTDGGLSDTLPR